MRYLLLIAIVLIGNTYCLAQTVAVYPTPEKNFNKVSDMFLVSIIQNDAIKKSFIYKASAGNGSVREYGREQKNSVHFTTFSFFGDVIVKVTKLNSKASSATIRPSRLNLGTIRSTTDGENQTISFKLSRPEKLSVEFDDDLNFKNPLMIFADSLEKIEDVPKINDAGVYLVTDSSNLSDLPANKSIVYFKPGVYTIDKWEIPSSVKQVYISGGAYVKGYLYSTTQRRGLKINGRGILTADGYKYHYPDGKMIVDDKNYFAFYMMIFLQGGQNYVVDGITITEATNFNIFLDASKSLINNVKIISFRYNNDGMSINNHYNTINNCFIRTNDDAITMSGTNHSFSNMIFWQLQGSIFQLGWKPNTIRNVNILNCDVIHDYGTVSDQNVGFINSMNYNTSDKPVLISDFLVSNIYFDTPIARFLDIRGQRNFKLKDYDASNTFQPWVYKNFVISNIHLNQPLPKTPLVFFYGFDESNFSSNFTIQNFYINNVKILKSEKNNSPFIDAKNIINFQIK